MKRDQGSAISETASLSTKLVYGLGAAPFGIKDNGLTTFLMIYFNQVLGVPALWVGFALFIALCVDAVSDPWIGHLSDNTRGRSGRRHPFLYAAILPVAISYAALWHVPDLSVAGMFGYLIGLTIIVRLALTFYEVPHSAMLGEITQDYADRTMLNGLRLLFGWVAGIGMAVLTLQVLLVDGQDGTAGVLNRDGYQAHGLVAACVMAVAMLISALGTQSRFRALRQREEANSNKENLFETLRKAFQSSSFTAIFLALLSINLLAGMSATLGIYLGTYLYGFSTQQIALVTAGMIPAVLAAFAAASLVGRRREKVQLAKRLVWGVVLATAGPVFAGLLGWLPDTGSTALVIFIAVTNAIATGATLWLNAVAFSMGYDLIDAGALHTGKRADGVYVASFTFTRKIIAGLGVFATGVLLSLGGTSGGALTNQSIVFVAWPFVGLVIVCGIAGLFWLRRYRYSQSDHLATIAALNDKGT